MRLFERTVPASTRQSRLRRRADLPANDVPLIACRGLGKTYRMGGGDVTALAEVDLDIRTGEYVAIMGPSGSGKSTFMNLLGALDRPSTGRLAIDGTPLEHLSTTALAAFRNRTVGFVFQQFNLLARTKATDNVALPLLYTGMAARERRRRALTALDRVGLKGREDHWPTQLSGGQQQRVAIARALVTRPRLLLADEPTGALDTATSAEIMKLFGALNAEGITVVLVTHEPEIADHAKRRLLFRDGRLVEDTSA